MKSRRCGDIRALKRAVWRGICCAERVILNDEASDDKRLRAVATLATAAGVYAKILEASELEGRLSALERRLAGVSPHGHG